jgi:hypothetical protein
LTSVKDVGVKDTPPRPVLADPAPAPQWIVLKDVTVDLSTYYTQDPYVYLFARVDDKGIGTVDVYWFTHGPPQAVLAHQTYDLNPGDLVVDATTKHATLAFPGTHLTWAVAVGVGQYASTVDFSSVVVEQHRTHNRTQRILNTGAWVTGTLVGEVFDPQLLYVTEMGLTSAYIRRELQRDLERAR